jgi:uncharacterized membrane protein
MDFATAASQCNAVLLSYNLSVIVLPLFALYVLYMFPEIAYNITFVTMRLCILDQLHTLRQ